MSGVRMNKDEEEALIRFFSLKIDGGERREGGRGDTMGRGSATLAKLKENAAPERRNAV